ncbi:MAG TPA: 50S ribosomal protein L13 [Candidatus Paceibacterota bacterium]|jgi:large subunit ribosomal protein L13|nr:50S ribosomal protein L13 [Candidatus Paceibacterota bacterium]
MITIDAQNKTLGRVASAAAKALLGKHAADFAKHVVSPTEVKVTNVNGMKISGTKARDKDYIRYTGYPGGLRSESYQQLTERRGNREALRRAVLGMLPKNKLQMRRIKLLTIEN